MNFVAIDIFRRSNTIRCNWSISLMSYLVWICIGQGPLPLDHCLHLSSRSCISLILRQHAVVPLFIISGLGLHQKHDMKSFTGLRVFFGVANNVDRLQAVTSYLIWVPPAEAVLRVLRTPCRSHMLLLMVPALYHLQPARTDLWLDSDKELHALHSVCGLALHALPSHHPLESHQTLKCSVALPGLHHTTKSGTSWKNERYFSCILLMIDCYEFGT